MTNEWSAFYPLSTDANESSGAYNGVLQGSASFANDPAHGNVLNLDGRSGYVSAPIVRGERQHLCDLGEMERWPGWPTHF